MSLLEEMDILFKLNLLTMALQTCPLCDSNLTLERRQITAQMNGSAHGRALNLKKVAVDASDALISG